MFKGITTKRFAVLASVAAIIAVALIAGAALVANLTWADEPERLTRQIQIDASKEKTHFLGPFRPDGTLDYLTAINQQLHEGVTSENNAFRELAKLLRPKDTPERYANLLKALEITEQEIKQSPSFTTWDDAYRQHIRANTDASEDETKALLEEMLNAPLTDESSQMLAKWVELNREALAICDEALARERYWVPQIDWPDGNGVLVSITFIHSDLIRELSKCYRARLMLAAKANDSQRATDALQSMLRLAKLQSNEASLIGGLVAIAVEAQAIFALRDLLNQGLLSEPMANQFAKVWAPTDGRVPITRHIDTWERCMALDALMQIASGRSSLNAILSGEDEQLLIDQLFVASRFDVNNALNLIQTAYDELVGAMQITNFKKSHERTEALGRKLESESSWAESKLFITTRGEQKLNNQLQNPEHTLALTRFFLGVIMPGLSAAHRTDLRVTANYRNCHVAIAVERYLSDRGQLPDSLEQLVPTYLTAIPLDPFDLKPLKYRRIANGYSVYSLGDNLRDDEGVHNFDDGDIAIMVERFAPAE